ncbi:hypothetical protein [Chitinophaga sp. RAB17]|uniref:hypothetical protein n=1 Tax=Chitinophaga sp. RAB17 TaxID=3233049 RepID=UPI003F925E87
MIIGNANDFAIEIADYNKAKNVAKLKLFLKGKVFGSFKKAKEIDPLLSSLDAILDAGDDLYDASFDDKSVTEIFSTVLVLHAEVGEWTDSDYNQLDRYERFTFFLGEQFSDVTAIVYVKEDVCNIVWSTNKDMSKEQINYLENLNVAQVPMKHIAKVKDEFMDYLDQ